MGIEDVTWRKSSYSNPNGGNCVEVATLEYRGALLPGTSAGLLYLVRDSKALDGPRLAFTTHQWGAFIAGIKDGEFAV